MLYSKIVGLKSAYLCNFVYEKLNDNKNPFNENIENDKEKVQSNNYEGKLFYHKGTHE